MAPWLSRHAAGPFPSFPYDSLTGRLHLLHLQEHPDWDDCGNAMIYLGRCLIWITPTKAGSTVLG